jgi:hypothetical protein
LTIARQLRPVNEATATIATRTALTFDPIPIERLPREVRPLVEEINRLLARLQVAVDREHRFVRDAAHALRTPLTALQLQADVLEGGRDPDDRAARLAELRAGIRRVINLSEQLLTLARAQSTAELSAECSELDPMLQDIVTFYQGAARAKGITLEAEAESHTQVRSSRRRLTLVLGNLIDNALRHTPVGGAVSVRARRMKEHVYIDVCDGPAWSHGDSAPARGRCDRPRSVDCRRDVRNASACAGKVHTGKVHTRAAGRTHTSGKACRFRGGIPIRCKRAAVRAEQIDSTGRTGALGLPQLRPHIRTTLRDSQQPSGCARRP